VATRVTDISQSLEVPERSLASGAGRLERSFEAVADVVVDQCFREGLHVTGLNTAATLWCSAAVGLLAGSGHPLHAVLATSFVVLVNLTLRPLVRIINRQPITQAETDFHDRVRAVCRKRLLMSADGFCIEDCACRSPRNSLFFHLHRRQSTDHGPRL
jgi:uncharacterized membrane protein YhiD involved in acid resistance